MKTQLRALAAIVAAGFRIDPARAIGAVALVVVGHLTPLATTYGLKLVVDAVAAGDRGALARAAVVIAAAVATSRLTTFPIATVGVTLREKARMALEREAMSLYAGIPGIQHHEDPRILDKLDLFRRGTPQLGEALASLVDNIGEIVLLAGTAVLLARVDPLLALLPLFALPAYVGAAFKERRSFAWDRALTPQWRAKRGLFDIATEAASGMELRLFGTRDEIRRRWQDAADTIERSRWRISLTNGLIQSAGDTVLVAGQVAAVVLAALRAVHGALQPGDVLLTVALANRVGQQVTETIEGVSYFLRILHTVGDLLWLRDYAASSRPPGVSPAPAPRTLATGIALERVTFRYPGTERDVLRDVSLRLPAGRTVALVGDNGAGKTTLVKLLCRFYEPAAGRILVDGADLAAIDPEEWRARLSGGFQDFARLHLVARESVGVPEPSSIADDAAVLAALERAAATDVLEALPHGLDTQLGARFEGGVELSGGQWQKIAIARGMMREAPLLLVLDEPTAALDAKTEHALFDRFARAARATAAATGAITLFVSHRFSTVRTADLIVVVDGGCVTETGTHEELVARGGIYAELYELQARAYR